MRKQISGDRDSGVPREQTSERGSGGVRRTCMVARVICIGGTGVTRPRVLVLPYVCSLPDFRRCRARGVSGRFLQSGSGVLPAPFRNGAPPFFLSFFKRTPSNRHNYPPLVRRGEDNCFGIWWRRGGSCLARIARSVSPRSEPSAGRFLCAVCASSPSSQNTYGTNQILVETRGLEPLTSRM